MTYTIERNIPLPDWQPRAKYPFAEMRPGDSILFRDPEDHPKVLNAAYGFARRHNWKMVTRQTEDGLRIWRME